MYRVLGVWEGVHWAQAAPQPHATEASPRSEVCQLWALREGQQLMIILNCVHYSTGFQNQTNFIWPFLTNVHKKQLLLPLTSVSEQYRF